MKSVSSRLLAITLTITVIGMISVTSIGSAISARALHEQSLGRVSQSTMLYAGEIDTWIQGHSRYISAAADTFSSLADIDPKVILPALTEHENRVEEFFSVYVGYPGGLGVFSDGWEPDYNEWRANERDWYVGAVSSSDRPYITDLYVDADTGSLCVTISKVIKNNGAVAGVVAADIFANVLNSMVNSCDVGEGSYAFLTDAAGNILAHQNNAYAPVIDANGDMVCHHISEVNSKLLSQNSLTDGSTVQLTGSDGVSRYYTAAEIHSNGWVLYTAISTRIINAPVYSQIWAAAIVLVIMLLCTAILIYLALRKLITRPIKDVTEAARLLAGGEVGARLDGLYVGEIRQLADAFREMEVFNTQLREWIERIADGDFSFDVQPRGANDRAGHAILEMLDTMNGVFTEINSSTYQVAAGSKQIANGAQVMAQGSTQQAAAVEQLSASISDIAQKTKTNASLADKAAVLANSIKGNAEKGSRQMDEMMAAVRDINAASQNIGKVISVIDNIAFQTNILALNAAVEAARAGQHGKGFAVVAEEVRSLASKSAEAAKDTGSLIADSMEKAELGSRIANETAASLAEIVSGINESGQIVFEIAQSSDEQSSGIAQINNGIGQVAQVIQQNSATAQESAAACEEMSGRSDILEGLIARFKLKDGRGQLPPPR